MLSPQCMARPQKGQIRTLKKTPQCKILISESHVSSQLKWTAGSLSLAMGSFNAWTSQGPNILTERGFTLIRQETLLLRYILFTRNATQPFPKNAGRPSQTPGFVKRPPPPASLPPPDSFYRKRRGIFSGKKGKENKKNDERVKQSMGLRCIYLFHGDYESLHQQDSKWGAMCWGGLSGRGWGVE